MNETAVGDRRGHAHTPSRGRSMSGAVRARGSCRCRWRRPRQLRRLHHRSRARRARLCASRAQPTSPSRAPRCAVVNQGFATHDVTAVDGTFASGPLEPGTTLRPRRRRAWRDPLLLHPPRHSPGPRDGRRAHRRQRRRARPALSAPARDAAAPATAAPATDTTNGAVVSLAVAALVVAVLALAAALDLRLEKA